MAVIKAGEKAGPEADGLGLQHEVLCMVGRDDDALQNIRACIA